MLAPAEFATAMGSVTKYATRFGCSWSSANLSSSETSAGVSVASGVSGVSMDVESTGDTAFGPPFVCCVTTTGWRTCLFLKVIDLTVAMAFAGTASVCCAAVVV